MLSGGDRDKLTVEMQRFLAVEQPVGVPITCEVVDAPNVHLEILAQADRQKADLIVMGTHGRSGFQRLFLGSVTEKVLRTAHPPVLTVGAAVDVVPAHDFSFKRILCAVDFSGCSLAALRYATTLGRIGRRERDRTPRHGVASGDLRSAARTGRRSHRLPDGSGGTGTSTAAQRHRGPRARGVEEIVTPASRTTKSCGSPRNGAATSSCSASTAVTRSAACSFGSTAEPVVRRATCPVLTVRSEVQSASVAA